MTLVIVQQRMGSTRLPGKAKEQIAGLSLTEHVLRRAERVVGKNNVVLAVPSHDDFSWCNAIQYRHPGDENDVLGRMFSAASSLSPRAGEVIVRLTGDCPFVPEECIEAVIRAVENGGYDYAETRSDPSSRPNGIDAQAFTFELLAVAEYVADTPFEREHITPVLKCITMKDQLVHTVGGITLDDLPYFRVTIDTEEDLRSARRIAALLGPYPSLEDLVALHRMNPDLFPEDP